MDALRDEAGVSLRRLYRLYPSKEALVDAYLRARDHRWRAWLRKRVEQLATRPREKPLAVFDALEEWFAAGDFRGCALTNATAELGESTPAVPRRAEEHKHAVRSYLAELVRQAGGEESGIEENAARLMLLVDGAIVQASVTRDPGAAQRAKAIAERVLSP